VMVPAELVYKEMLEVKRSKRAPDVRTVDRHESEASSVWTRPSEQMIWGSAAPTFS
jgi:hypothetical protein